jgi:hypothetical protein
VITEVLLTNTAEKNLQKVPRHIIQKFIFWVNAVSEIGLRETRKSNTNYVN